MRAVVYTKQCSQYSRSARCCFDVIHHKRKRTKYASKESWAHLMNEIVVFLGDWVQIDLVNNGKIGRFVVRDGRLWQDDRRAARRE